MALSMYQAFVPVFIKSLGNLSAILDKSAAFAAAKKVGQSVLLVWRLAPDMLAMARQVQIACDFAKGAPARLAGMEVPWWETQALDGQPYTLYVEGPICAQSLTFLFCPLLSRSAQPGIGKLRFPRARVEARVAAGFACGAAISSLTT